MTENELPIQANNESIKTLFWAKMLLLAKTMLLLLTIYAGIRILMFLLDYIKLQRLVADMPGPKEKSFLKGSFFNVRISTFFFISTRTAHRDFTLDNS